MPGAPIAVTGFSHVAIAVTDLGAAREFYCGVLGFEELPRPDLGIPGMWLKVGALQLHFIETDEMPTPGRGFPHYALHVPTDEFEATIETLRDAGVPFLGEPSSRSTSAPRSSPPSSTIPPETSSSSPTSAAS